MARLFKRKSEREKSLWKRVVNLALSDVRVLAAGVDTESLEDLEEKLLAADFGVPASLRLTDRAEEALRRGIASREEELIDVLRSEIIQMFDSGPDSELVEAEAGPTVYLIVGVNGVGKTTSIAKLASHLIEEGRSVMIAAADTFRAGAVAQLQVWAERTGADFIRGQERSDPAAVAFDALEAAAARRIDFVLIDTAGRLHTNSNLLEELAKIERVVSRKIEGAPHETLMVLDATVGQNAVRQVEAFSKALGVTGIILSKMDSSAKGGIVVALKEEHGVPVKLIGVGERLEDLEAFDVTLFLDAALG